MLFQWILYEKQDFEELPHGFQLNSQTKFVSEHRRETKCKSQISKVITDHLGNWLYMALFSGEKWHRYHMGFGAEWMAWSWDAQLGKIRFQSVIFHLVNNELVIVWLRWIRSWNKKKRNARPDHDSSVCEILKEYIHGEPKAILAYQILYAYRNQKIHWVVLLQLSRLRSMYLHAGVGGEMINLKPENWSVRIIGFFGHPAWMSKTKLFTTTNEQGIPGHSRKSNWPNVKILIIPQWGLEIAKGQVFELLWESVWEVEQKGGARA